MSFHWLTQLILYSVTLPQVVNIPLSLSDGNILCSICSTASPGIWATQCLISTHYVWPGINADVRRRWTRSCFQCQCRRLSDTQSPSLFLPHTKCKVRHNLHWFRWTTSTILWMYIPPDSHSGQKPSPSLLSVQMHKICISTNEIRKILVVIGLYFATQCDTTAMVIVWNSWWRHYLLFLVSTVYHLSQLILTLLFSQTSLEQVLTRSHWSAIPLLCNKEQLSKRREHDTEM